MVYYPTYKSGLAQYMQQADAVISQANPVTATWYTVLGTVRNARITSISSTITWAVTQPTPLEVRVTIDGISMIFVQVDPDNMTTYFATVAPDNDSPYQRMQDNLATAVLTTPLLLPFLLEGRSVKVEVRITWATTQPTPLVCRVKYARRD